MHSTVLARLRPIPRPLAPLSLLALLGASSFAPAFAQARSDVAVRAEIAFARGLASDWGFVEMAQGVVSIARPADEPTSAPDTTIWSGSPRSAMPGP